jgi:spore coat polysaccharide biosynthesis protein SpsF
MTDLAIVLTVRLDSERLYGKTMADVEGKPLLWWIIKRLQQVDETVVIATTDREHDDPVVDLSKDLDIPCYCGDKDDVVTRVDKAVKKFAPDASLVMRGLGDCPFVSAELVTRATDVLIRTQKEAFVWHVPPDITQRMVYGSRELPISRSGWERIVKNAQGDEREHTDLWFHRNREKFDIVYHEAPDSTYFRDYRLEVDWEEDLELVRAIAKRYDMLAPLSNIVRFLDESHDIVMLNRERVERTGLTASYDYTQKRQWLRLMRGVPVVAWDDTVWQPPDEKAQPIFCDSGQCLLGYGWGGVLYRKKTGDRVRGRAYLDCRCGAGRVWNEPK